MAVLLFNLRGVPDDEAQEVRQLLGDHQIDYYETSAGNFGLGTAAIWLKESEQQPLARQLLAQYQQQRVHRVRSGYDQLRQQGRHRRLLDSFRDNPVRFIMYLGFIALLLYLSIKPFMTFGTHH